MLQALNLWAEITGVKPGATSWSGMADIRAGRSFEELQEALVLDPTEVTASLLLDHMVRNHLRGSATDLMELANNPEAVLKRMEKPRELLALLGRPEVVEARDAFMAGVREAVTQYGAADAEGMEKLLADAESIALLRRDALRSLENLRVDQFLDGGVEPAGRTPVYTKTVHQWWNINSLLAQATRLPAGVSLNLIRDPDAYQSFFVFTIRNGGNLFTLSDIERVAHPLQGSMSRRPERTLESRAARNWFPYDLLGVAYDEESGDLYFKTTEVRALVAYQNELLPLKPIAELDVREVVWIAMMFDLIVDRFWRKGWKAPALSYTAEMIKVERALANRADDAGLPVLAYQPLTALPLTREDLNNATEEEIGDRYNDPNDWLEKRYGHLVPEEALNMVALPEAKLHLTGPTGEVVAPTRAELKALSERPFWEREDAEKGTIALVHLPSTAFGSAVQLSADRKFLARVNQAKAIDALAAKEFNERKADVLGWYVERMTSRIDVLLSWAGNPKLWVDNGRAGTFDGFRGGAGDVRIKDDGKGNRTMRHSLIERYEIDSDEYGYRFGAGPLLGGFTDRRGTHYECVRNKVRASWLIIYSPTNPTEIALLCGCEVSDLPDVLQQYDLYRPYRGNCILDRIDPMAWAAHNPWNKIGLKVRIPLSKRAMTAIDKAPRVVPTFPGLTIESADK